jgi:hypothetical protein
MTALRHRARVILYGGYPGHGDPAHAGGNAHIHVWQHAPARPFTATAWVDTSVRTDGGAGA